MKTLAALTLAIVLAQTAQAAEWRIKPEATVRGETMTLADFVENAPEKWANIPVGQAPRPGRASSVEISWLKTRALDAGRGETFIFPPSVTVNRPGRTITREEIENEIMTAALNRYGRDMNLAFESVNLPPQVPEGETAYSVRLPRGNFPTKTTIWVDVTVDGKIEGRASARVESKPDENALSVVLVRPVKKGDLLRREDLALAPGRERPGAVSDIEDAMGKVALRSFAAGASLQEDQLGEPTLVEKGSVVRLVAKIGRVTATTAGRAVQSGAAGDMVGVENLTSGQIVHGIVREAGMVEAVAPLREVN